VQQASACASTAGGGRSGDWLCGCGNNNFAFRAVCNKCGGPKTEGAYTSWGMVTAAYLVSPFEDVIHALCVVLCAASVEGPRQKVRDFLGAESLQCRCLKM